MDVKKQLFTDAETNTVSSSGNNDEDNYEDGGWEEVIIHRVAETKMTIMMSRMIQVSDGDNRCQEKNCHNVRKLPEK